MKQFTAAIIGIFLIVVLSSVVIYFQIKANKPVNNTANNTQNTNNQNDNPDNITPTSSPITATNAPTTVPNKKELSFVVKNKDLERPAGGDTKFSWSVPTSATLIKNDTEGSEIQNAELDYTIKDNSFEINISQYYETFPLKFPQSFKLAFESEMLRKVYRHTDKTDSQLYFYTNSVAMVKNCTLVSGQQVTPPCGSNIINFTNEDLKSYIIISCKSGSVDVCDQVVKSTKIEAVPGSACSDTGCI